MPSVLFVCTANICRSPMAMALWKQRLGKTAEGWKIESAGTWAPEGEPAAWKSQQVMRARGLDLSNHASRQVTRAMVRSFDLILVMEHGHKEALRVEFPEIKNRVYLLSEMIGPGWDIPDPYGSSLRDFEETAQELEKILEKGEAKIISLATSQEANRAASSGKA